MKTITNNLIIILLFSIISIQSNAQTVPAAPKRMEVYMAVTPGDTTMKHDQFLFRSPNASGLVFHSNTQLNGTMNITLGTDTSNIDSVHVMLGSSDGANDLYSGTFANSQQGTFPDGTSYFRKGYSIFIGLGQYTGLNQFYAQVWFSNRNGSGAVYKYAKQ